MSGHKALRLCRLVVCWAVLAAVPVFGQDMALEAFDTPGDAGGSVVLRWQALPAETAEASYQVLHGQQPDGPFSPLVEFAATSHYETELAGPWWVWGSPRPDWHRLEVELDSGRRGVFQARAAGRPAPF